MESHVIDTESNEFAIGINRAQQLVGIKLFFNTGEEEGNVLLSFNVGGTRRLIEELQKALKDLEGDVQ